MKFLLSLAWQDLRGSGNALWVMCACLILGITLIAATGGLYQQILGGLKADSRKLSGGDLQVESRTRLPEDMVSWMQARGTVSLLIELDTMMGADAGFQLVEVQSVDEHYPLYGQLELEPALPLGEVTSPQNGQHGLAMDPILAERMDIKLGDTVDIGQLVFEVRALIVEQPDRRLSANWRGTPVLVSEQALLETGLVLPTSRIEYEYRVRTTVDPEQWQLDLFQAFPDGQWEVSTFLDRSDSVGERLAQAGSALLIIGLSTLFIGGLGVFNSVQAYLQGKLGTIATLRSLGLRNRPLAQVYLLQILIMSGASCLVGAALGFGLSLFAAAFATTEIQVSTAFQHALLPAALSALFGLMIAMTFAAPAIGRALSVDPAVLFRSLSGIKTSTPRAWWLVTLASSVMIGVLLLIFLPDRIFALAFIATLLGLLLMLEGIVRLIRHVARRMDTSAAAHRQFATHLALANLHRNDSALRASLLTLGSALTLLVTCTVLVSALLKTISETIPEESPDMVLYDIAPYQLKAVKQALQDHAATRIDVAPLVQGRLQSVNGEAADANSSLDAQREARDEHKLTYRADNIDGVTMVQGDWWSDAQAEEGAWVVMEDREANQIGLEIGDQLVFNIEGRQLEAQLAGIFRQQGLQTRFWFEAIFSDGALDPFISRYVAAGFMPEPQTIAAQEQIADVAPNVISVRTSTIVTTARELLGTAVMGIAVISAVALAVSLLVLTGVMASHRSQQVYYSTILHTLGARLSQIRRSLSMEYLLLAVVTACFALLLGILIALPMLHFQLRLPLTIPLAPALATAFGVSFVCLYLGAKYLMRRLQIRPAELLRGEG